MMSSVFDNGAFAPCPQPFNMAAYVLSQADRLAAKTALEVLGPADVETWTFAQLKNRVARCAGGLINSGLAPGDRVLFRLGNSADFPFAYLACIWAGLIPVPASTQLTVSEITEICRQVDPAAILHHDGVSLPTSYKGHIHATLPDGAPVEPIVGDPNRLAYIVFTSGTSGRPRGVCHAHRAIWARRMMWDGWYGLTEADRMMHAGAFNWTYTLGTGLMDPWSIGATALIPKDGTPTTALAALCHTHKASIFAATPGVYRQILKQGLPELSHLRHGLTAGEALPHRLRQLWLSKSGRQLHEALGMSECSTFISGSPAAPATPGTSGRPQTGRRIAVLHDGEPVPFGEAGQLAISTSDPGLMLGYLDTPPVSQDWFVTGDTVSMSEAGDITYLGRGDDMMNAGGYRVSPLEVESTFSDCDGLQDCAAAEVKIKADTHVIALFYTAAAPLPEDRLRAHAQSLLARYKQPRLYIFREALPKGANGKLNRRILRDSFRAPDT